MRLCTYRVDGGTRLGEVVGDRVWPLAGADVRDALHGVPARTGGEALALGDVELLAPLVPGTVLAVGRNYARHAAELDSAVPETPVVFIKHRGAITGPGGPVVHPGLHYTRCLDYEVELAVVIGRRARGVTPAEALAHVFGYAILNDVSARDLQDDEPQWLRAKGGPTFGPFGPWVTTADEVPDPQALRARTWINGELRQDASTADMLFGVADIIAWCSASFVLEPGDVIAMGTPEGVGHGMDPPVYLTPGDRVHMEIDGLGSLRHEVVA